MGQRSGRRCREALQLYSQADQFFRAQNLGGPDRNEAAEVLLLQAIAEDPEFASAHLLLAWSIRRQGRPSGEFLPHTERALDLADTVSEPESYFIRASHLHLKGENEAAIPIYQALIERYPDHFWGRTNLIGCLGDSRRLRELVEALRGMVSLRPNNVSLNVNLASATTILDGLEASLPLWERARSLVASEKSLGSEIGFGDQGVLEAISAWELWLRGDLEGVAAVVERVEKLIAESAGSHREDLIWNVRRLDNVLGRLARAERWTEMVTHDFYRPYGQLTQVYLRSDKKVLGQWLENYITELEQGKQIRPMIPELLARLGRPDEAEALVSSGRVYLPKLVQAHIDLARGNLDEAVRGFEEALPSNEPRDGRTNSRYFMAIQSLAEAHLQLGDPSKARMVLEEASRRRSRAVGIGSGVFWLMHQVHLADFYREQGLIPEAQTVESEVLALLALADADHPLLVKLQGRVGARL